MYAGRDEKAERGSWESFTDWLVGAEDSRPSYFNRIAAADDRIEIYARFVNSTNSDPENERTYALEARQAVKDSEVPTRDVFLPALGVASNLAMISYWYAMAAIRSLDFNFYSDAVMYFNKAIEVKQAEGIDYQNATEITNYYDQAISAMKQWREANPSIAPTVNKSLYMLLMLADRSEAQIYANMSAGWHVGGGEILSETASQTVETVKKPFVVAGSLVTGNKPPFLTSGQWLTLRITLYSVAGIYALSKVAPIVRLALEGRRRRRDRY